MDSGGKSYYDILHVQQNAPTAIIKNAYRALMLGMKYHPDLGGDSEQAAKINLAYETLSNKKKRAEYDQMLSEQLGSAHAAHSDTSNVDSSSAQKPQKSAENAANSYKQHAEEKGTRCPFCYKFQCIPATEMMDCSGCGSPLDPPPQNSTSSNAARSIERITKDTVIQITEKVDSMPKQASLKDLSPQGLGFVSKESLAAQQVVRVDCALFEGLATVVHIRPEENGSSFYGAQFISLRFQSQSGNFISTRL